MYKKGFTLVEVLIAAVLIAIAVAGGLASFEIAHRQVEGGNLKYAAMTENMRIQEMLASLDIYDPRLSEGRHEVEVENDVLKRFNAKAEYEVEETRYTLVPEPHLPPLPPYNPYQVIKEITVRVSFIYGGKEIEIVTRSLRTNNEEPTVIEFWPYG